MADGVAIYEIELPGTGDRKGRIIKFEGPKGLTQKQLEKLATDHLQSAMPGQRFSPAVYAGVYEDAPAKPDNSDKSSSVGAFLRNLPHEATFNFDDEFAAAANATIPGLAELEEFTMPYEQKGPLDAPSISDLIKGTKGNSWRDRYKFNLEQLRRQKQIDEEEHPVASGTGKVAGVLSSLPRAAAAAEAKLVTKAPKVVEWMRANPFKTGVTAATAGGAASGAGAGTEGHRGQSAALGAVTGGALGVGILGGMKIAPAVLQQAKVLFNKGADTEAVQQIIQALKRDGYDIANAKGILKLRQAISEFAGKPVSLADVGSAVRARAGVGLRSPSNVQQQSIDTVMSRQAGQGQRLATDVRKTVSPRTDVHALDEELVAQRAAQAKELRDKALFVDGEVPPPTQRPQVVATGANDGPETGLQRTLGMDVPDTTTYAPVPQAGQVPTVGRVSRVIEDPELQQLARLPDAQKALGAALDRARSERDLLAAQGKDISHLPDLERGSNLDVRTLDYLKRFLDDEVNSLYRRGDTATFKAGQAAQVKALRDAIRERLRTVVPEYGDYLDAYKGSSEMIDSLEQGRTFDTLDPEQIVAAQADRSQAGQELYKVGVARNLLDKIRSTRDNSAPSTRILNSDEARSQLAATGVPAADAAALNKAVSQERQLSLLPRELQGSQTDQRALARADADAGADMTLPFNPGSPLGWAGAAMRGVVNHVSRERNAAVNEQLLPKLLETNPQLVDALILDLERQGKQAAADELRRNIRMLRTSIVPGAIIGGPVSIQGE